VLALSIIPCEIDIVTFFDILCQFTALTGLLAFSAFPSDTSMRENSIARTFANDWRRRCIATPQWRHAVIAREHAATNYCDRHRVARGGDVNHSRISDATTPKYLSQDEPQSFYGMTVSAELLIEYLSFTLNSSTIAIYNFFKLFCVEKLIFLNLLIKISIFFIREKLYLSKRKVNIRKNYNSNK